MKRVVIAFGLVLAVGCTKLVPPSARSEPQVAKKSEPQPEPPPPKPEPKVEPPKVEPPKVEPPKPPVSLKIDPRKLILDYATDRVAADAMYHKKLLTVPVVVHSVRKTDIQTFLYMSTIPNPQTGLPEPPNFWFRFEPNAATEVNMMLPGNTCVVEGVLLRRAEDNFSRGGLAQCRFYLEFLPCRLVK